MEKAYNVFTFAWKIFREFGFKKFTRDDVIANCNITEESLAKMWSDRQKNLDTLKKLDIDVSPVTVIPRNPLGFAVNNHEISAALSETTPLDNAVVIQTLKDALNEVEDRNVALGEAINARN